MLRGWTPGEVASIKHPDPKRRGFLVVQKWTDQITGESEWRAIRTIHESEKIMRSDGTFFKKDK